MLWPSTQCLWPVVRRFLRDENVVDVAFPLARLAHADEFRSPAQFHETRGPHVAHSGLHSANQLLDIRSKRSAMRYAALDSFGHELALGNFLLAVAIAHPLARSEEHTSELQSRLHLVCRLLLEKKKKNKNSIYLHKKKKKQLNKNK